jgi:phenylacetate-CoA ligase
VPSFVVKLLEYAQKYQINVHKSAVKKILCIGEPIRYQDFSLNVLGQRIQNHWPDVQLISTYASTEMSTAFTECEAGKGGHVLEHLIYVEILDENGNPVSNGEVGELVITTLQCEAMPLMRFKTGDICRLYQDTCACGRTSARLGPIIGRKKHMVKYKGTTFYPFALKDILAEIPQIESYYIEISENELQLDEVKIFIYSSEQSIDLLEYIRNVFQSKIRVTPQIIFETKEKIETVLSMNFRKPNDVLDNRKRSD